MKKIVLAAAIVALSSTSAFAAGNTATATGTANATVVAPLTLTHTGTALNFGSFTTGAGTVVVTTAGVASNTGAVNTVSGNAATADQFTVAGDGTRTFAITTTNSTVKNGTTTMAFTTSLASPTGALAGGAATFNVGGTLTALGTEGAGLYTGTYSATVTYN